MRVAVIGANGQLGSDVVAAFAGRGDTVVELNHDAVELTDRASLAAALERADAPLVVNTAAMHHVDKCEENPAQAFAVNALGVRHLALECAARNSQLVQISTDYVFDGSKRAPYTETDAPLPLNAYGNSKLAGEYFVRTRCPRHYVLRISAIFGRAPCRAKGGNNFVTTMLKLARERDELRVVDSEIVSPSYTVDVARQMVRLVDSGRFGLYHATGQGQCSWYRFAQEIFRLAGLSTKVSAAGANEFPAKTPRPTYSVLDNEALRRAGLDVMRPWEQALAAYLAEIGVTRSA